VITTALLVGVGALMVPAICIGFDDWRAARRMRKEKDR